MIPRLISTTDTVQYATTNPTGNYPASGIIAGDLLVQYVANGTSLTTVNVPSGYTALDAFTSRCRLSVKIAAGTENGGTYSNTAPSSDYIQRLLVVRGWYNTGVLADAYRVSSVQNGSSATSPLTYTAVTMPNTGGGSIVIPEDCLVLAFYMIDYNAAYITGSKDANYTWTESNHTGTTGCKWGLGVVSLKAGSYDPDDIAFSPSPSPASTQHLLAIRGIRGNELFAY